MADFEGKEVVQIKVRPRLSSLKPCRSARTRATPDTSRDPTHAVAAVSHLPTRYPQGGVEHDGPQKIVVHPIVLLHAVDHYNRVAKDTKKRVVGILLGETRNGVIQATSSYALPFEEDERDLSIWFLDHSYHEEMYKMCRKVNVREKLVGWYTTGPKIRAGDLQVRPPCPALRSSPGT